MLLILRRNITSTKKKIYEIQKKITQIKSSWTFQETFQETEIIFSQPWWYTLMKCISPLTIRRNTAIDTVPCGRCNFCLSNKRNDWTFRLYQEFLVSKSAYFLTMTYADEHCPITDQGILTLEKRDVQLFTKRLRKQHSKFSSDTIRYYTVGEYGTQTHRPHYHSIMFNLSNKVDILKSWQLGHVHVGAVTLPSIHYTTKYSINQYVECKDKQSPFALISKRSGGLGKNYLDTHTEWHRESMRDYTQVNGVAGRLPAYYRQKIFSVGERAGFALNNQLAEPARYWEKIENLKKYHPDPEAYYDEIIRHSHELLEKRANKNFKI